MPEFNIAFVCAPDHMVKLADEILRANIRCQSVLRREIRAVAKAYIDEADELQRSIREIKTQAEKVQIQSLSPPEMIEKAKRLRSVRLASKDMQVKVRKIAESYVLIGEKNQHLYDEFMEKYRDQLPPNS